jgi:hypothetical protein
MEGAGQGGMAEGVEVGEGEWGERGVSSPRRLGLGSCYVEAQDVVSLGDR